MDKIIDFNTYRAQKIVDNSTILGSIGFSVSKSPKGEILITIQDDTIDLKKEDKNLLLNQVIYAINSYQENIL